MNKLITILGPTASGKSARAITVAILTLFLIGIIYANSNQDKKTYPSEKKFYEKSDIDTDVWQLTSDPGNDQIFYQEPNYFSPDGSLFLFKSSRDDGKEKLYLLHLDSGEITRLRDGDFGHIPTWSADGRKIYIGESGKIIAVDVKTGQATDRKIPADSWLTFLDANPAGDKILFVEEGQAEHKGLSIINTDGSNYQRLFSTDYQTTFYIDHPTFIDNQRILFLTRGHRRDFTGEYNKPYILDLNGGLTRLSAACSHYDVNPKGDKILCASEGYIIDLAGRMLKSFPNIKGHGVWAPDGDTFLMTGDPVPVPSGPHFGKIVLLKFSADSAVNLVSHESTYNSTLAVHIQPNAQFSRDGQYIIYESDRGQMKNSDLYLVKIHE